VLYLTMYVLSCCEPVNMLMVVFNLHNWASSIWFITLSSPDNIVVGTSCVVFAWLVIHLQRHVGKNVFSVTEAANLHIWENSVALIL
jgi:hypothetical protein